MARPAFFYSKCPVTTDKNAIRRTYGGYASNKISGSGRKDGYVLPNCCGFVHAQWLKFLEPVYGISKALELESHLCIGNAEDYYSHKDEFPRGKTPKLGAIAVFEGKGSKAGHVEIVKEIKSNGNIVCLSSAWGGDPFHTRTRYKSSGYSFTDHTFLGFIYLPFDICIVPRKEDVDQVKISGEVNVRSMPTTSAPAYGGLIPKGYYDVLDMAENGGYVWYQVEDNAWVAGTARVEFLPRHEKTFDVTAYNVPESLIEEVETFLDNHQLTFKSEEN